MSSNLLATYLVVFTVIFLFDENVEAGFLGFGEKKSKQPDDGVVYDYYQDIVQLCFTWDKYVRPGEEYNNRTGFESCVRLTAGTYKCSAEQATLACAPQVFSGLREDYANRNVANMSLDRRAKLYTAINKFLKKYEKRSDLPKGDLEALMEACNDT